MTTVGRGVRNAFRGVVRTISVVVILGLSIGLAPHPSVWVRTAVNRHGHRHVAVKIKGRIPAGDTMLLAFSGDGRPGRTSLGAGGVITGPVPRCVSLPAAPSGAGSGG